MNVRYSTRIGYGYVITRQEYKILQDDDELWDEFCKNSYTFAIDSWEPDTCPEYFFGLQYGYVPNGHAHRIPYPEGHGFTHEQIIEMIDNFKKFFPNHKDMMCHDYVLSCID